MGLSDEDFWRLTPREFNALARAREAEQRNWDARFGLLAAILANAHRDPKKRAAPFEPKDFFPSLAKMKKRRQTVQEQKQIVSILAAVFGGELKRPEPSNEQPPN